MSPALAMRSIFVIVLLSCLSVADAFQVTATADPERRLGNVERISSRAHAISLRPTSRLFGFFGDIFGGDDPSSIGDDLASFTNLARSGDDASVAYNSVAGYLKDWAALYKGEGGKQKGLTTPVSVSLILPPDDENDDETVYESTGVKFTFKPPENAYFSKSEERASEEGRKEKEKKVSPGGLAVIVERVAEGGQVQVIAKRCDIEEGTVVKEMSEQFLIGELRTAIQIWKDERKNM